MSLRIFSDLARLGLYTGKYSSWRILPSVSFSRSSRKLTDDKNDNNKGDNVSERIDEDMKSAVKSVAESLPGDPGTTERDLFRQVLWGSKVNENKDSDIDIDASALLGSMKITKKRFESSKGGPMQQYSVKPRIRSRKDEKRTGGPIPSKFRSTEYDIFEGPGLGIFTPEDMTATTEPSAGSYDRTKTLRHQLEQEELAKIKARLPNNGFDEMIAWTKEGKMWTFPIDNEAGITEELNVGFHQHVFLEDQIADFPKKGPIKHFMDLVVVALSKNPYLTVKQKHDHINWFRSYFKEKGDILKDNLGEAADFVELKAKNQ